MDYLPPDDKVEIPVMILDHIPYVKIQANMLRCSQQKFITKDTFIFNIHPPAFENIADSNDIRSNLGQQWVVQEGKRKYVQTPKTWVLVPFSKKLFISYNPLYLRDKPISKII